MKINDIDQANALIEIYRKDYEQLKSKYSNLEKMFFGLQVERNHWKKRALTSERMVKDYETS